LLGESKEIEVKRKRINERAQTLEKSFRALKRDTAVKKIIDSAEKDEKDGNDVD
jgi:hypothetical protein